LVFGVHGFEDAWAHDGLALFEIANRVIAHYSAHPDELKGWTVTIIPTANPDGMREGKNNLRQESANAYGRCTSEGKDINRNFSTASFAEHDALETIADESGWNAILDFHGWYNCYYGNARVGDFFAKAFNATYEGKPKRYCFVSASGKMDCGSTLGVTFHKNSTIEHDLFAEWANSKRKVPAAIIEYPAPDFDTDGAYDTVRDAASGFLLMRPSTMDLIWSRTIVGLNDLFEHL
jgi:hypothetical protein